VTTAYGVTDTGFVVKSLEECVSELQALFYATFGNGISLDNSTPEGQLIGIISERESELWDMASEVYASRDPDQATGAALAALAMITGTVGPKAATHSQLGALTLGGTTGTIVPAGSQASVSGTGVKLQTLQSGTLAAVSAWAGSHGYALGARATNGGSVYEVVTAGTSASSGGPTTSGTDITDGSVHWRYLGAGDGAVDVTAQAVDTGPLAAPSRTISQIETPVSGWAWVTNANDAAPGTDEETDAALRTRRLAELEAQGNSTVDAIRAHLLRVAGVTACTVFENITDTTDTDGRPPHSVEVVATGGATQDLLNAVWAAKPGGIQSYGTTSGTVVDSQGTDHTVSFARPVPVPIYLILDVAINADLYPADGDAQVEAAVLAYGIASLALGVDVIPFQLSRVIEVSGVEDVTIYLGTAPAPSGQTKISIGHTQQAVLDSSRITVTSSPFVP